MIRRLSNIVIYSLITKKQTVINPLKSGIKQLYTNSLCTKINYTFADLPKHQVLSVHFINICIIDASIKSYYVLG
jgi:hypothetical protein